MQTLSVPVGEWGERVSIFEQATAGSKRGKILELIPCRDDDIIRKTRQALKQSITNDVYTPEEEKQVEDVMRQVGLYSRAMGRMLV